jgi:hypothetical protein
MLPIYNAMWRRAEEASFGKICSHSQKLICIWALIQDIISALNCLKLSLVLLSLLVLVVLFLGNGFRCWRHSCNLSRVKTWVRDYQCVFLGASVELLISQSFKLRARYTQYIKNMNSISDPVNSLLNHEGVIY